MSFIILIKFKLIFWLFDCVNYFEKKKISGVAEATSALNQLDISARKTNVQPSPTDSYHRSFDCNTLKPRAKVYDGVTHTCETYIQYRNEWIQQLADDTGQSFMAYDYDHEYAQTLQERDYLVYIRDNHIHPSWMYEDPEYIRQANQARAQKDEADRARHAHNPFASQHLNPSSSSNQAMRQEEVKHSWEKSTEISSFEFKLMQQHKADREREPEELYRQQIIRANREREKMTRNTMRVNATEDIHEGQELFSSSEDYVGFEVEHLVAEVENPEKNFHGIVKIVENPVSPKGQKENSEQGAIARADLLWRERQGALRPETQQAALPDQKVAIGGGASTVASTIGRQSKSGHELQQVASQPVISGGARTNVGHDFRPHVSLQRGLNADVQDHVTMPERWVEFGAKERVRASASESESESSPQFSFSQPHSPLQSQSQSKSPSTQNNNRTTFKVKRRHSHSSSSSKQSPSTEPLPIQKSNDRIHDLSSAQTQNSYSRTGQASQGSTNLQVGIEIVFKQFSSRFEFKMKLNFEAKMRLD